MPKRWFFTDEIRTPDPGPVIRGLDGGTGVVFRHYHDPERTPMAASAADVCRARGGVLLIAGDPALASKVRAQGVHWPEAALETPGRTPVPPWLLRTAAVHSHAALARAEAAGVDAVFVSPVFPTASHPGRKPLGLEGLAQLCAACAVPVFALGGVTAENAESAMDAGAAGVAGIGLFL